MKIGDKVKRKSCYADSFTYDVNDEYIIVNLSHGDVKLTNHKGEDVGWWDANRFDVVAQPDYLAQFKEAQALIGKTVEGSSYTGFLVKSVELYLSGRPSSVLVENYLNDHDFCVVLKNNFRSVPFEGAKIVNDFKELKISDDYTAKIYKDKVEVGCQTIPISTVEEIIKLANSLD
jgi:hypothetical protein